MTDNIHNKKIIWIATLGEIMLRLSPEREGERIVNAKQFIVEPGGSESNVAMCLSYLGHRVRHITRVPKNVLGEKIIRYLRGGGVSVDYVYKDTGRIGCYWTEIGKGPRPSMVEYDRDNTAFGSWDANSIKWEDPLRNINWFHSSGITPAISQNGYKLIKTALDFIDSGISVSFDLNYRNKLWKYIDGETRKSIVTKMDKLVKNCDYIFGNETDFENCLGIIISEDNDDLQKFYDVAVKVFNKYEKAKGVAISSRTPYSASDNGWTGYLFLRKHDKVCAYVGPKFRLTSIVDRIGAGDSFAAGIIHGLIKYKDDPQKIINFGTTISAVKHSLIGDACNIKENEVWDVVKSLGSGNVIR